MTRSDMDRCHVAHRQKSILDDDGMIATPGYPTVDLTFRLGAPGAPNAMTLPQPGMVPTDPGPTARPASRPSLVDRSVVRHV